MHTPFRMEKPSSREANSEANETCVKKCFCWVTVFDIDRTGRLGLRGFARGRPRKRRRRPSKKQTALTGTMQPVALCWIILSWLSLAELTGLKRQREQGQRRGQAQSMTHRQPSLWRRSKLFCIASHCRATWNWAYVCMLNVCLRGPVGCYGSKLINIQRKLMQGTVHWRF